MSNTRTEDERWDRVLNKLLWLQRLTGSHNSMETAQVEFKDLPIGVLRNIKKRGQDRE